HESLAFLESLGCPRYKIASFEITDLPLISAVAQTGKPVVISTGMAREMEVARAWDVATQEFGSEEVTLLKCT
ncbi:MAG: N-acetylneuraminate synthase family protein, partial [Candidatus Nanopelagicales bacterium]